MVAAAAPADVNVVEIIKKDKKKMKGREAMTTTTTKEKEWLSLFLLCFWIIYL